MDRDILTADRVRELLHYDPTTGLFTWLVTRGRTAKVGGAAGNMNGVSGYVAIGVDGRYYRAHRLAWLYVNGEWPVSELDHINGGPSDNRLVNLSETTRSGNMQNQRRNRSDNAAGLIGVGWREKKKIWRARITLNGKQMHLGEFKSPQLAHEAYLEAKRQLHPKGTI